MDINQTYRTPAAQTVRLAEIREMAEMAGRHDYLEAIDGADGYTLADMHVSLWQEVRGRPARRR